MKRLFFYLFLCLFLIFPLVGCAVTPKLSYSPKLKKGDLKDVSVTITEFLDGRSSVEKSGIIGGFYNAYDDRGGDIREPRDFLTTLKQCLESELRNRGYQIVPAGGNIQLTATLESVACNIRTGTEAIIYITASAQKGATILFDNEYEGRSHRYSLITNCSGALTSAVEKSIAKIVQDLDKKSANRTPSGGEQ